LRMKLEGFWERHSRHNLSIPLRMKPEFTKYLAFIRGIFQFL